jgi:hypothetical protein
VRARVWYNALRFLAAAAAVAVAVARQQAMVQDFVEAEPWWPLLAAAPPTTARRAPTTLTASLSGARGHRRSHRRTPRACTGRAPRRTRLELSSSPRPRPSRGAARSSWLESDGGAVSICPVCSFSIMTLLSKRAMIRRSIVFLQALPPRHSAEVSIRVVFLQLNKRITRMLAPPGEH